MMAVKKSGLGRGLDALFPEKSVPSKSGAKDTKEKTAVHPVKTSEKKEEKKDANKKKRKIIPLAKSGTGTSRKRQKTK